MTCNSPRVAADDARAALQRLNDYYLRTICRLLPSTPRRLRLTKLGLLPKNYDGFTTSWSSHGSYKAIRALLATAQRGSWSMQSVWPATCPVQSLQHALTLVDLVR